MPIVTVTRNFAGAVFSNDVAISRAQAHLGHDFLSWRLMFPRLGFGALEG
jgi:hypothetical protein